MCAKKFTGADNPLAGGDNTPSTPLTVYDADKAIYGGGVDDIPRSGRVIARPIGLVEIRPDVRQPRRIIPAGIRKGWTGDVSKIPDMLRKWWVQAEQALGDPIHVQRLIEKFADGRESDKDIPPIVDEFLSLCALAASIYRDGLANPIQVTNNPHVIVTGERRYMAHWLLKTWEIGGGKFDSIPAQVVNAPDVWLQAAENGARRPLNAIGMARQLALLVMAMYLGDDGVSFDDMTFFDHERQFYAQVANGVSYPIKKGLGERVLQVTGLNSKAQVNQYRAILKIDNDLWDEADANNWAEGRIREMVRPQDRSTIVDLSANDEGGYMSTAVDVSADDEARVFVATMREWLEKSVRNDVQQMGFMARGRDAMMFVYWGNNKYHYEIVRDAGGAMGSSNDVQWLAGEMYEHQPLLDRWVMLTLHQWQVMINPPKRVAPVPVSAPPPYNADEDDVMMDDGEGAVPFFNRPFGDDSHPPHDVAYVPQADNRYIEQGSLLRHFIGMAINWSENYDGKKNVSALVQLRDMNKDAVMRMVNNGLSANEIAQELTALGDVVNDYLAEIHSQLAEAQGTIWADVPGGDDE